jgi:hypothetical protein
MVLFKVGIWGDANMRTLVISGPTRQDALDAWYVAKGYYPRVIDEKPSATKGMVDLTIEIPEKPNHALMP